MNQEQNDALIVLASQQGWDMVASLESGVQLVHEFFLININISPEKALTIRDIVMDINARKILGKGYSLKLFDEPYFGCHVMVEREWYLDNSMQSKLFLEHFLKLVSWSESKNDCEI